MQVKTVKALSVWLVSGLVLVVGGGAGCRRNGSAAAEGRGSGDVPGVVTSAGNDATVTIEAPDTDGYDLQFREEIRRKFRLAADSMVEVSKLNGPVTIETIEGDEAEVLIVRSAKSEAELRRDLVRMEQRDNRLEIGLEKDRRSLFGQLMETPRGRQRAVLRLPSRISLAVFGINGRVMIDEVEGRLEVSGVNGRTQARRVSGPIELSGNNGAADLTMGPKFAAPIEISGVNGAITLRFEGEVNATLEGHGNNGRIESDLPGYVAREDRRGHGEVEARIGSGGPAIEINGVNGSIRLLRATAAQGKGD